MAHADRGVVAHTGPCDCRAGAAPVRWARSSLLSERPAMWSQSYLYHLRDMPVRRAKSAVLWDRPAVRFEFNMRWRHLPMRRGRPSVLREDFRWDTNRKTNS
jgi:hypothetical protein